MSLCHKVYSVVKLGSRWKENNTVYKNDKYWKQYHMAIIDELYTAALRG